MIYDSYRETVLQEKGEDTKNADNKSAPTA